MDKEILKGLADNPMLFDAVKAMLLKKFEITWDKYDWATSSQELGEEVKARLVGMKLLNAAFDEIATYKSYKEPPTLENPAR